MFWFLFAIWSILPVASSQTVTANDVATTVGRAEKLYYDAQFQEAIGVLGPLDVSLQSQPGLQDEKIRVKVLLALAYIGINDNVQAKSLFKEVAGLDTDFSLSPEKFSDNVLALFDEAKAEGLQDSCRQICQTVNRSLDTHDLAAVLDQVKKGTDACTCLKAAALDAAELAYTDGAQSFRDDDFADALVKFRNALEFNREHVLSREFLELTRIKLRLIADATFLEWRKNIDARQFALAVDDYRKLQALNLEGIADPQLNQIQAGYRALLSESIEGWKRACQDGDSITMRNLWAKATEVLPAHDLVETILSEMKCDKKFCSWTDTTAALTHVVHRVEPTLPADVRRSIAASLPTTVYAHVRIDETGTVEVVETQGTNAGLRDAIRNTIEQWKFAPAEYKPQRCTETIIPVFIPR
jgi:hypothetical protein